MTQQPSRQQAKAVLLNVLGMKPDEELNEDDDFYLLGGDSLLAVQAIEELEALGFCVDLSIFYQTGHIGEILDSILPAKNEDAGLKNTSGKMKSLSIKEPSEEEPLDSLFEITEWKKSNVGSGDPSGEEIRKLLTDVFAEKDAISQALQMQRSDLEAITKSFFLYPNYIILAFLTKQKSAAKRKLVGAVLSCALSDFESYSVSSKKIDILQKYLDSSHPPHQNDTKQVPKDKIFYAGMIGVVPPNSEVLKEFPEYDEARWKRMILEILSQFERKIIEQAKNGGFHRVERVNTTEITMKFSLEMGYRVLGTSCLKDFAEAEHLNVDPKYYNHHCYYMVKDLEP